MPPVNDSTLASTYDNIREQAIVRPPGSPELKGK
jgi:hypothetical protein